MITIRPEQMKAFEDASLLSFEDEMVAHGKEFSPRLSEVIGDDQLRLAVRQAIKRADSYGFDLVGPIRLYIEMMFLYGSDFDTDKQYPEIAKILQSDADQMFRAERMHEWVLKYNEKVCGEKNIHVQNALKALLDFTKSEVEFKAYSFVEEMDRELTRVFPQKTKYIGKEKITELIFKGCAEAEKHGFITIRGQTMIVVLMFAFGHGCLNDPLYPWISRTLKDKKIKGSAQRVKRLERKSLTWLDHVLARSQAGKSND